MPRASIAMNKIAQRIVRSVTLRASMCLLLPNYWILPLSYTDPAFQHAIPQMASLK